MNLILSLAFLTVAKCASISIDSVAKTINLFEFSYNNSAQLQTDYFSIDSVADVFLFVNKSEIHSDKYLSEFKKTAEKFVDQKVHFLTVDCSKNMWIFGDLMVWTIMQQLFLSPYEDCPKIIMTQQDEIGGVNKFNFENYQIGNNSANNLTQFIENVIDGKIAPYVKSEDIPKVNNGTIFKLVSKQFNEIVLDPNNAVFVNFYNSLCTTYQDFAPYWQRIGDYFYGNPKFPDLIIAEIDVSRNEFVDFEIYVTPTLMYYPKGENKEPVKYPRYVKNSKEDFETAFDFVMQTVGENEAKNEVKNEAYVCDFFGNC